MRIWQMERNKDVRMGGPSCFGLVSDPSGRAGENSRIHEVVISSEVKLLLKCKYKTNDQIEVDQNFRIEGLSDFGKRAIKFLKNDYRLLINKTIAELRNAELEI